MPAVLRFTIPATVGSIAESDTALAVFPLAGNPLDVALLSGHLVVSVDTVHEPASTEDLRTALVTLPRVQDFDLNEVSKDTVGVPSLSTPLAEALNNDSTSPELSAGTNSLKPLRDLLYGYENLRKRGNEDT